MSEEFDDIDDSFDPDEYLASKAKPEEEVEETSDEDFDPDEYLASKAKKAPEAKTLTKSNTGLSPKLLESFKKSIQSGNLNPIQIGANAIKDVVPTLTKRDIIDDPLATGIASGATFDLNDEAAGVTGGAMDAVMGTGGEVPGESNLEKFKRLYTKNRDVERERKADIANSNPNTYLAGDLTGSFALPLGAINKGVKSLYGIEKGADASRLAKAATNLTTGGTIGAIEGAGRSENNINTGEFYDDTLTGAGYGVLLPAAIEGTIGTAKSIQKLGEKVLPENYIEYLTRAKNLGKNNVNIKSPEFKENFIKVENQLADEAADVVGVQKDKNLKVRELDEFYNNDKITKANNKQSLENQKLASQNTDRANKIEEETKKFIETETKLQQTQNEALKAKLTEQSYEQAKHLQVRLDNFRANISKEYDDIYEAAGKANVRVDTAPITSRFYDQMEANGVPEKTVLKIRKEIESHAGDPSLEQLKTLKQMIHKYTDNSFNPELFRPARQAYKDLGIAAQDALNNSTGTAAEVAMNKEIGKRLLDANKKWGTYSDMDDFVQGIRPDKNTSKIYAEDKTLKTIEGLADNTPQTEKFTDYWKNLAPIEELAPAQQLSKQIQEANAFKPQVPKAPELLQANPEYQNIQSELNALKNQKPIENKYIAPELTEEELLLSKFGRDQVAVKNNILRALPKMDTPFDDTVGTNKLNFIENLFNQQKGQPAAQNFVESVNTQNIDRLLGHNARPDLKNAATQSGFITNAFNALTGGGTGNMSNKLGLMEVDPNSKINKFKQFMESNQQRPKSGVLLNTIDDEQGRSPTNKEEVDFFKSTPESLQETSARIKQSPNAHAQAIARKLDKAATSDNSIQRNALLFSLMQDPTARKMIQNDDGSKDEIVS